MRIMKTAQRLKQLQVLHAVLMPSPFEIAGKRSDPIRFICGKILCNLHLLDLKQSMGFTKLWPISTGQVSILSLPTDSEDLRLKFEDLFAQNISPQRVIFQPPLPSQLLHSLRLPFPPALTTGPPVRKQVHSVFQKGIELRNG